MTIEFVDELPEVGGRGGQAGPHPKTARFLDALRANPGKWAKWYGSGGSSSYMRSRYTDFEWVERAGVLYGRFPTERCDL